MKSRLPLDPAKHEHQTQRLKDKKPFPAYVLRVCDGDTIQVARNFSEDFFSGTEFIRLAAINAPEMKSFDARAALWSQQYLAGKIFQKVVTITPRRIWRDPYHRIIATVTFEGEDIGACLVRAGHAVERKSAR